MIKSGDILVQEIHNAFYTEVDRLLAEAFQEFSLENKDLKKIERLRSLGFSKSVEINRLKVAESYSRLSRAISYFKKKCPDNKFITANSVRSISNKYGLEWGSVDDFIGTVPDKYLEQIERFELPKEDVWKRSKSSRSSSKALPKEDALLEILAFPFDFELESSKETSVSCVVVLQPVSFEGCLYYLIVTAWRSETIS